MGCPHRSKIDNCNGVAKIIKLCIGITINYVKSYYTCHFAADLFCRVPRPMLAKCKPHNREILQFLPVQYRQGFIVGLEGGAKTCLLGNNFSISMTKNYHNFHQGFVFIVLLFRSLIVFSIAFILLSASVFVMPL